MEKDSVTAAVARALRQLACHRMVRSISAPVAVDGGIEVVVEFDSGLGNRWRAVGRSESGVLAVEPVTFVFTDRYPLEAPDVFLRPDFDRSHPHLQPTGPRLPPVPCYVEGRPRELLRMRGIDGIADQIASWLKQAADFSLIDFEQGWEPVRRDHIDDVMVADADLIRAIPGKAEDAVFLDTLSHRAEMAGGLRQYSAWVMASKRIPFTADHLSKLASRNGMPAVTVAAWSGKRADGSVFLANRYRPETVGTVQELLSRAVELGCGSALRAKLALIRQRVGKVGLGRPLIVGVILLARRPCNLVGQRSPIELCPYLVEVTQAADLEETSDRPVRLAMHRDRITTNLLRRASGLGETDTVANWSLLGAGSLGSKIAVHLARQANGPSAIVDRSWMLPHNFARHALVPFNLQELIEPTKVEHLRDTLQRLNVECTIDAFDVASACVSDSRDLLGQLWGGKDFVLDTTGSPTVTEALCSPAVVARPPAIEASLLAGGRIAYAAVEGPTGNPSLLDLRVESYRLMAEEASIMDMVFSVQGQAVMLGQGCSAVTSPMTDAMLSATAAPLAARVARIAEEGLPDIGEILIGRLAADCLGQIWTREPVPPFTVVDGGPSHPTVRISSRVLSMIDEEVANRPGSETGGVIVGRFSEIADAVTVVDLISAPPDSTFKPSEFKLGTEGLSEAIEQVIGKSAGTIYPLGTWHNHLDDSGPSRTDIGTGALIAAGQNFPALLLIRTPNGFRALWAEAFDTQHVKAG